MRRQPHNCMARTPAATSVVSYLFPPPLPHTILVPMQEGDDHRSSTGCKLRKTTAWAFRQDREGDNACRTDNDWVQYRE